MQHVECPVCIERIPETHVEWEAFRATCPRCHVVLVLDGDLVPNVPIDGWPDRLIARREPNALASRWVRSREGPRTVVRRPWLFAFLVPEDVTVAPEGVVVRTRGVRAQLELADVHGAVGVEWVRAQHQTDMLGSDRLAQWEWGARTLLIVAGREPIRLYDLTWLPDALHVAAVINDALDLARHAGAPYR